MKKWLSITLGIVTATGGFLDAGQLVCPQSRQGGVAESKVDVALLDHTVGACAADQYVIAAVAFERVGVSGERIHVAERASLAVDKPFRRRSAESSYRAVCC